MMTRAEFERDFADKRRDTISGLRKAGYWSAPSNDTECGWQALASPPDDDAAEENMHLIFCRFGSARSEIKPFGSGGL